MQSVFTLRTNKEEHAKNKALADSIGMPLNSFYRLAAAMFRESYSGAISRNQAEFRRFVAHNQQQNQKPELQADC